MAEPAPGPSTAPPGTPGDGPAPASLRQTLQSLWRELPGLVSDRVELLTLEMRRTSRALAQIVMLVVAAAILGVTAWLVLWGGVVAALLAFGLHLAWALLAVLVFNLLAVWLALARVRRLLPRLGLPATRRHLTVSPSPQPEGPSHATPQRPERPEFPAAGQPAAR